MTVNGVRVTLMPTTSSSAELSPDRREAEVFLEMVDQVLDRFRPDVLLTYGGHPANLELIRQSDGGELPSSSILHNFRLQRSEGLLRMSRQ